MAALKFDVAVHDHHTHRHYAGIDAMIAASGLSDPVKERARRIFRRLAEAEALVHGVPLKRSISTRSGRSIPSWISSGPPSAWSIWGSKRSTLGALPLGSGFVETAHGRLPVPAPATAELMKGLPVHGDCGPGERVTPTGAAIVAALASGFGKQPAMLLERVGNGAGGKDFPDCPNILRAFLGRSVETAEQCR